MYGNIKAMMSSGISSNAAKAMVGGVGFGLTSTGADQSTAYALQNGVNIFLTVAGNTGARLSSTMEIGEGVFIANTTVTDLNIYPPSGGSINGAATNAAIILAAGNKCIILKVNNTGFVAMTGT